MFKRNKLILVIVLAGAMALATIGIVRAQTANTNTPAADTQVNSVPSTANTDSQAQTNTTQPCAGKHQAKLDETAKLFGMSVDDLQKELKSGKQFYQIAAEHGVTYDKLKADRLAEIKTKLDDMVKVGFMTQTEADQIYQQQESQPMMGGFGFGHGMHWWGK